MGQEVCEELQTLQGTKHTHLCLHETSNILRETDHAGQGQGALGQSGGAILNEDIEKSSLGR